MVSGVGGATGGDFNDSIKARFGTGNDLEIYHDGSNSYIEDTGTGNLILKSDGSNVQLLGNSQIMLQADVGGAVNLYHGSNNRFFTVTAGAECNGSLTAHNMYVKLDSGKVTSGASDDFQFYHDGFHNHITRLTGQNLTFSVGGVDKTRFDGDGTINSFMTAGASKYNVRWFNGGVEKGSIVTSDYSNNTTYNTSSDYRLKENIVNIVDSVDKLKELKPRTFNFKSNTDLTMDGFIAHEVSDVVSIAITGEKDAVDADGNPAYQGIDQSKLIPVLVGALQEAIARIEALEA